MIDYDLLFDTREAALRVEFLTTNEELILYSSALYLAIEWGRKVGK